MGVIYKITNIDNGKIYVGQTRNLKRRIKEYKYKSKKLNKKSKYGIVIEMNKIGFDNFKFEIIEEANDSLLNEKEIYWINKLDSRNPLIGYNSKEGGKGGSLIELSKHKMSESSKAFRHSEEEKIRRSKPIFILKNNTLIPCVSAKKHADSIGRTRSEVSAAIKRGIRINGNFIFYQNRDLRLENFVKLSKKKSFYSSDYYIEYITHFKDDLSEESVETNY